MQKLTILILITLILSPCLSAEDDSIILDRDILYWTPSEPDILIPDTFFSPELFRYPEDAFRSTLFFPLNNRPGPDAEVEDKPIINDKELLLNWTPPTLFRVEEFSKSHTLRAYGSYPYGSGLLVMGSGDLISYKSNINYAHDEGYPHWIATELGLNSSLHNISTAIAYRSGDDSSLLSILSWNISSQSPRQSSLSLGISFQSLLPVELSVLSEDNSGAVSRGNQWKAGTVIGADIHVLDMNIGTSLRSGYFNSAQESYWMFSPELLLAHKLERPRGDWSLEAGMTADLYEGDREHKYFPQLHLDYINYGQWSIFFESRAMTLDDARVHSFLTEEVYHSPIIDIYRQYILEAGFSVNQENFQINAGGGYSNGVFPEIQQGILESDRKSLYFIDYSISWNYRAGKVTELNCYADYQDKGSLRYFLESRWLWRNIEEKHAFSFLLRAGNRELLRGYRYFFDDSSDFMTETGLELDFFKPLQTAVYMDYLPLNRNFEGRIELSWVY